MEKSQLIYNYTLRQIKKLCLTKNESEQKASFANLRHGIGKEPGDNPYLWGEYLLDMPEELMGKANKPEKEEWAVYITLTLFSLHQQGKDVLSDCMYKKGNTLGTAMGMMMSPTEDFEQERNRILRRIAPLVTSESIEELAHYLRAIIELLKIKDIPLDWPQVAKDIYYFQFESIRNSVKMQWGKDFYKYINKIKKEMDNDEE